MTKLEDNVATLLERTNNIHDSQINMAKDIKTYGEVIGCNTTNVALVKQSLSRVWWWLGGISLTILAVAVKSAMAGGDNAVGKLTCFIMTLVQSL